MITLLVKRIIIPLIFLPLKFEVQCRELHLDLAQKEREGDSNSAPTKIKKRSKGELQTYSKLLTNLFKSICIL